MVQAARHCRLTTTSMNGQVAITLGGKRARGCVTSGRAWLLAFVLQALALPVTAAAASPERGPVLNWVRLAGAEHCIAPAQLAEAVETRLGVSVFVPPGRARAILVIEGRVEPLPPQGFKAVLDFTDPDGVSYGTRELALADTDCRKLDPLLSLVIALTIQRGSGSGIELPDAIAGELDRLFEPDSVDAAAVLDVQPTAAPAPSPTARVRVSGQPSPARQITTPAAAAPGTPERRREPGPWGAALAVSTTAGVLPAWALGAMLGLTYTANGWGIGLFGRLVVPQERAVGGNEPGTLDTRFEQAGLSFCTPELRVPLVSIAGCAAVSLGMIHVSARDFLAFDQRTSALWLEGEPRARARTGLWGASYLQLTMGLPIRFMTPDFGYRSAQGAITVSAVRVVRVGLLLELGLGVEF